jgi:hypothetical protein
MRVKKIVRIGTRDGFVNTNEMHVIKSQHGEDQLALAVKDEHARMVKHKVWKAL